jgi:hypothetical protein
VIIFSMYSRSAAQPSDSGIRQKRQLAFNLRLYSYVAHENQRKTFIAGRAEASVEYRVDISDVPTSTVNFSLSLGHDCSH